MDIEDPFWNIGHLTHPNEDWAVNQSTQAGIEAYLKVRSCSEELRRIGIEVLQVVDWSILTAAKLESLKTVSEAGVYTWLFIEGKYIDAYEYDFCFEIHRVEQRI